MRFLRALTYLLSSVVCLVSANGYRPDMNRYSYCVLAALALAGVGLGATGIVEGILTFEKRDARLKRVSGFSVGGGFMTLAPLALLPLGTATID